MSGRKSNIKQFQNIVSGDMQLPSITSIVSNIEQLDNIGIQFNFTGSPTGTFQIQVSADYNQDTSSPPNVISVGNWIPLNINGSSLLSTSVGSPIYVDLPMLSAPWIRTVYTNTLAGSVNITTLADVANSLNNTYFLINGSNGTNWYVWYDDGAGVDPALPGRTGIQVTYTTGDSADTIATLTKAALSACTSVTSISGTTNHVIFSQSVVGAGSVIDGSGASATHFTIAYTSNTGTLIGWVTGKML